MNFQFTKDMTPKKKKKPDSLETPIWFWDETNKKWKKEVFIIPELWKPAFGIKK